MVTRALRLIQGEHKVSGLKLSLEEKKSIFGMRDDTSNEMVYANLIDQSITLPLQSFQHHFHLMKPQKYTLPDQHTAYVFTMVRKRNVANLCNWGEKVLKDLIKVGIGSSYQTKRYIGCGQVI